jgi:GNAT superfamily N-acetyltransferase
MAIEYRTELPPIDKYVTLFHTTGWSFRRPVSAGVLQMALERSWYCLFAWDGNALVGTGRVCTDGLLHAIIYDVIVAPDYQGRGIGAEIMNRIMQKCLEADIGTIQLFAAAGKQGFYEKLGFAVRPADAPGMQYRKQ